MPVELRFWSKVSFGDGCFEWQAHRMAAGYGWFSFEGKPQLAHRVAWTLTFGCPPPGLHVLHRCDNRGCVNTDHLFLGTNTDNILDRVAKGRSPAGAAHYKRMATQCKNGHPWSDSSTYWVKSAGATYRRCSTCTDGQRGVVR